VNAFRPASRMRTIPLEGGIREILARATELEKAGRSIIHMEIGRPDFASPDCAVRAAQAALEARDVHYTDMAGTEELRCAIADKLRRENGLDADPAREIVVTAGAIEALMMTFLTVLEPGEEVLVPAPFFPAYADQISLAGGVLVPVPCRLEKDFRLQVEDVAAALSPKSRILLLNTPNNPSGAILHRSDLEALATLAAERNLLVIADECYEKFLYDGTHVSMASLPGMRERTVTINAASKAFSMTGWRVGYAHLPAAVKPYAVKVHQNLSTCACSFAQAGVAEAFRSAEEDVRTMIAEYRRRRDAVVEALRRIPGMEFTVPQGAFYAFPSVRRFGMPDGEFCRYILEEAGVAIVPGSVFGAPDFVRIAYCRSLEDVEEGMRRIAAAVSAL
jgi:aspartate/methionine/tyrosine aminotransferase